MDGLTGYCEKTGFTDTASGILFVQEAGGIVTDWRAAAWSIYEKTGATIVANKATTKRPD